MKKQLEWPYSIVDYIIKKASGLKVEASVLPSLSPSYLAPNINEIVEDTVEQIVMMKRGLRRCRLCGRGPYTSIGFYLHLTRVHYQDIARIVEDETKRFIEALKKTGGF